jgi:hypothetical protein
MSRAYISCDQSLALIYQKRGKVSEALYKVKLEAGVEPWKVVKWQEAVFFI